MNTCNCKLTENANYFPLSLCFLTLQTIPEVVPFLPAATVGAVRSTYCNYSLSVRPVHLEIYRLHQGYSGNLCQFWGNDHIIAIHRFHHGYLGNCCHFWSNDHIIAISRFHQGYLGNSWQFWENDHTIAIYRFHQGYPGN